MTVHGMKLPIKVQEPVQLIYHIMTPRDRSHQLLVAT